MKHFESHFEEYVLTCKANNFHSELEKYFAEIPSDLESMKNVILFGRPGCGKYTQSLLLVNKFSPSSLKYEKKLTVQSNKKEYLIKISDVHFEIDMSLLGCNSKQLWHEMYNQIIDIVSGRASKQGIILCKNMQCINNDLLDVLYSYMQNNSLINRSICIRYVFITESICFFPDTILNCSETVSIGNPSVTKLKKHVNRYCSNNHLKYTNNVSNIKSLYIKDLDVESVQEKIIANIVELMRGTISEIDFKTVRESIYELFIYEADLHTCVWKILANLVDLKLVDNSNVCRVILETQNFLKLYNNNYRPIYHVERYLFILMKIVEREPDCDLKSGA